LLENNITVNEHLGDILRPNRAVNASIELEPPRSKRAVHAHRMLQLS